MVIMQFEDNTPPSSPARKKRKLDVVKFTDVSSEVIIWEPQKSRAGNIKCPKNFPDYFAKAHMFVIWSTQELMVKLLDTMRGEQQEFWKSMKNFKGSMVQGEYSQKNLAHLQGVVYFKTSIRSRAIFKIFAPYLHAAFGLQVTKAKSLPDAWHYCSKPHNNCECEHCEKARKCLPNWSDKYLCGLEPVGRGKKFAQFEKAMIEKPTKTNMIENYGSLYYRYHQGMDKIRKHYAFKKNCAEYTVKGLGFLSNFQIALVIDMVFNVDPKENRSIYWLWSDKLKTGKTLMGNFARLLLGCENCMDGIRSYKHFVHSYDGETFTHFNFAKHTPPLTRNLEMLEMVDDGGCKQAPHYEGEKKFLYTRTLVTANVPPPNIWVTGEGQRIKVCVRMRENKDAPHSTPEYNLGITQVGENDYEIEGM